MEGKVMAAGSVSLHIFYHAQLKLNGGRYHLIMLCKGMITMEIEDEIEAPCVIFFTGLQSIKLTIVRGFAYLLQFDKQFLSTSTNSFLIYHSLFYRINPLLFRMVTDEEKLCRQFFQGMYLYRENKETYRKIFEVIFQCTLELLLKKTSSNFTYSHSYKGVIYAKFYHLVGQHAAQEHQLPFYAERLYMSPGNLNRLIKQVAGVGPKKIIEALILEKAKQLLSDHTLSIYDVAEQLNFDSASSFSTFFKKHTLQTPLGYRLNL